LQIFLAGAIASRITNSQLAHIFKYGYAVFTMKTTIEITDALLARAKRHARKTGKPLRALVEEGIRRVLEEPARTAHQLPDRSVGNPRGRNPLEAMTWQDLRDEIYGGR
jgi:Arc/MetJ family transcription regulator